MKKILISKRPWETRVAITRDNYLQNIYFYSATATHLERSFFKGVVTKVLPGIQTAFVDIGQEKAGFLHISEIDYSLALSRMADNVDIEEDVNVKESQTKRQIHQSMDMGKILTEGESILVQVSKEPVYEKGAKLTRCFTLPGRFIVLMPNIPRIGISKKIEKAEERARLKKEIKQLLPEGMGAIIRTSSEDRTPAELAKDINYLVKTWNKILAAYDKQKNTLLVYEDLPLSLQAVRDNLDDEVEVVITDSKENQEQLITFIKEIAPEYINKVRYYTGPSDLFEFYGVNHQIRRALQKKVHLRSGASIIIEATEAMTVIDVNTGKYTGKGTMSETILHTNLEAAEEIVRQLRLRNIGGLIVIDFIDMQASADRQKLFSHFEKMLKIYDRFQSVVLKISEFGLVEMTRKRSGKTLVQQVTQTCSDCKGLGFVESTRTISYQVLQQAYNEIIENKITQPIALHLSPEVFEFITNTEFDAILALEKQFKLPFTLVKNKQYNKASYKIITKEVVS